LLKLIIICTSYYHAYYIPETVYPMCRLAYIPMLLSIFAVVGIGVGSAAAVLLLAVIVVLIIIAIMAIMAVLKPKTKGEVINSDFSIPYDCIGQQHIYN